MKYTILSLLCMLLLFGSCSSMMVIENKSNVTNVTNVTTINSFPNLSSTYVGGSAVVCVYNNGTLFASEILCP